MSRNVLRRLWAALPVRASRYKRVLAQAMDANTKALDYADRHAKAMALNAELAASEPFPTLRLRPGMKLVHRHRA